ncbi:EDD domain protein, DegV family [Eubacterium ruminantium]|nr:EDD domain protein, DegV family [Eubacterium ruminantium]
MAEYVISGCSSADLSKSWMERKNIEYIEFSYELGGKQYKDDFGMSVPPHELYERMLAGEDAKTSQISVGEYADHFRRILSSGKDLIHVTLSTGISGTYNSAVLAANDVKEEFPDRKIYIVDSMAASAGFGLLLDRMADLRDKGMSIEMLYAWTEENKLRAVHWFFSTDLTFYIKGGRVTKTAGFIGNILSICPLLNVDYMGRLIPREKIRTKKKVIRRIVDKMKEEAENGVNYDDICFISHSDCLEDAEAVMKLIEEEFPKMKGKIRLFPIGATIGCHTGPGTVALFFWGKKRVD